jgi:hypothetical protein
VAFEEAPDDDVKASGTAPDASSSRSLLANVEMMMENYLGLKVQETGKRYVMDLLSASRPPKFSK